MAYLKELLSDLQYSMRRRELATSRELGELEAVLQRCQVSEWS